jgi:glycosyltransferase involved in cell wall biosynthesis
MSKVLVCHATPSLKSDSGGIANVVRRLCCNLDGPSVKNVIFTHFIDAVNNIELNDSTLGYDAVIIPARNPFLAQRQIIEHVRALRGQDSSLVFHSHGLWSPLNHAFCRSAKELQTPLMISLHGMLLPWARRHKSMRKSVAWRLYQYNDLNSASLVHVTSPIERDVFEKLMPGKQIALIRFGVDAPAPGEPIESTGDQRLVFLGRIHPVKNLIALLHAWARLRPRGWRLVVAGPDEVRHTHQLISEATRLGIRPFIDFPGPVHGLGKWDLLRSASAVVLPSHSENFGLVVAEALACGKPVIASTGAPWHDLEVERCGWWVDPDVEGLEEGLRKLFMTSRDHIAMMGARGRDLVMRDYSWPVVAQEMKSAYQAISVLQ